MSAPVSSSSRAIYHIRTYFASMFVQKTKFCSAFCYHSVKLDEFHEKKIAKQDNLTITSPHMLTFGPQSLEGGLVTNF